MSFATPTEVLAILERAEGNAYVRPKTKQEKLAAYRAQALGLVNTVWKIPSGTFQITEAGKLFLLQSEGDQ